MGAKTRKTILFGNGLGMALDSDFFSLDKAIGRIWDGSLLDENHKTLIRRCLADEKRQRPQDENDMDKLQLALSACELLNKLGDSRTHWLTKQGQDFPCAVRKLLHKVAGNFHEFLGRLPPTFSDSLAGFLKDTRSHVATLNYDKLLYQPLIERGVLSGYDGALCDGFHSNSTGFAPDHLERKNGHNFGYYLHLHGSPLFVDRSGATIKLGQSGSANDTDIVSSHIVMTHVRHKRTIIDASQLLTTYWQYLAQAFQESDEIILVGYSGLDPHLNDLLKARPDSTHFRVIEWKGAGEEATRMKFWSETLAATGIVLVRLASILDFTKWRVA